MNDYKTDLAYCMNRLCGRIHQAAAWIPMLLILLAFFTLPAEMLRESARQSTASISTPALEPAALHGFQGHDSERHVEFGYFPESAPVLTHQRPSSLKDRLNRDDLSPRNAVPQSSPTCIYLVGPDRALPLSMHHIPSLNPRAPPAHHTLW